MDQSAGLGFPGAQDCQGDSEQGEPSGHRVIPATGCVLFASIAAPTTRCMTCEQPGTDQERPEQWKAQPTAEFSMSILVGTLSRCIPSVHVRLHQKHLIIQIIFVHLVSPS